MLNENFNVEKMFGLDAYEEKYGVTPQEQTDEILFYQLDEVGAFINRNAPNISDTNYLIFFKKGSNRIKESKVKPLIICIIKININLLNEIILLIVK